MFRRQVVFKWSGRALSCWAFVVGFSVSLSLLPQINHVIMSELGPRIHYLTNNFLNIKLYINMSIKIGANKEL